MNVSPLTHGTSRLSTLSIEGEKGSTDLEKLKYQLWANMIVLVIDNFKETIAAPKKNKSFTKRDLFNSMNLQRMGWHVVEMEWWVCTN